MAIVGKNIHMQWICTIKRKSSGRRIQPYLTLFPLFATENLSVSSCKEDWQRAAKKQRYDDELVVLSFFFVFEPNYFNLISGVIKRC